MVVQNLNIWVKKNSSQQIHNVLKTGILVQEFSFCYDLFWDMVDFVVNIRSVLVWDLDKFRKIYILGGLRLQTPDALGLNPSSPAVSKVGSAEP